MPRTKRDAVPNIALYNLRDARAETQEQTAAALNALAAKRGKATAITGNHISRWERGIVHPSRFHCQLLAEHFGVTVAELGLTRQRGPAADRATRASTHGDLLHIEDDGAVCDPEVHASQQHWLHIRRSINAHHLRLAQTAAQLYPPSELPPLSRSAGYLAPVGSRVVPDGSG